MTTHTRLSPAVLLLAAALAGCESSLDIDLATTNGNEDIERITVRVEAVELQDDEGGVVTIATDDSPVDLLGFQGTTLLNLVSGEEVPARHYRSLRLVLDDRDAELKRKNSSVVVPVRLTDNQPTAALDVTLSDDSEDRLLAVLDLRFSLSEQVQPSNVFRLRQVATAVRAEDAGTLAGTVDEGFVGGGACNGIDQGYAMYLYKGTRTLLTDYFADAPTDAPLVSATLQRPGEDGDYSYRFRGLPAGSYTLAFTCQADLDDPFSRQVLTFRDAVTVEITAGHDTPRNF